ADIQPPFSAQVLRSGDPPRFDRRRADPAPLGGLQPKVAMHDAIAASGVTFYTSSLAFSVLHPLGHLRHRLAPRRIVPGLPTPGSRCGLGPSWLPRIRNRF